MTRNASSGAHPSDESGAAPLESVLDGALLKLSPEGRDALVLRFFERQSYQEVGRRLGISEDAAKQRIVTLERDEKSGTYVITSLTEEGGRAA